MGLPLHRLQEGKEMIGRLLDWLFPPPPPPRLTISAPQQRMRKLTPEEVEVTYAGRIEASPFPTSKDWWVCEFTHDNGKTWKIVAAYPIRMGNLT